MLTLITLFATTALLAPAEAAEGDGTAQPLTWKLGENQSVSMILWTQLWARAQQLNPGSTIQGVQSDFSTDVGIRRARVLLWGKVNQRMTIMTHFGINNQTFNNARKPQVFMHDLWVEGAVVDDYLDVGVGLHYWNGVSRAANQSTMGFLAIDGPIFPWTNIERTDQFARQMGFYAKGKLSMLDYRVAVNKPFVPGSVATAPEDPGTSPTGYSGTNQKWSYTGYAKLELADPEGNTLPFLNGTYLGKKQVVNIGIGGQYSPDAMSRVTLRDNGSVNTETFDQIALGVDFFVDTPVGEGAWTTYALYQYNAYGPDYVRYVGIMNVADSGSAGNAYPLQGTGHTGYVEAGYLLPFEAGTTRLQPYAASQVSVFEALDAPMVLAEAGANWYLAGQNAKITAHWRNRPVFGADGTVDSRANEGIVQMAFRY